MDLIRLFLNWFVYIDAKDEVRKILNRSFAYVLLVLYIIVIIAVALSGPFTSIQDQISIYGWVLGVPIAWYLNRRGTTFGALIISFGFAASAAFAIDTGIQQALRIPVSLSLAIAPIVATRFIDPASGFWVLFFEMFCVLVGFTIRDTEKNFALRYIVTATSQLLFITAVMALSSNILRKALQDANNHRQEVNEMYEHTLRGWSSALELRDKETKGHTDRVTDMTVKVARAVGIKDEEITHIRRGAILHDIGKMGVPDEILLKNGPLDPLEWEMMKLHPVYAYNWLSSIAQLAPALDIPYCHHEKWDGSGYPRGLRGTQIPLSARIFSIVDNWDALMSKRPYHDPLPKEDTLAYIQAQAGKAFDPEIVKIFLREVEKE